MANTMLCSKCGNKLDSDMKFCTECGNKLDGGVKFCTECGNKLNGGVKFCTKCGTKVASTYFTDPRDGKTYKTVKIGDQIWMAENLNYECEGSKCFKNDPSYAKKYGRLYNLETAVEACPPGWHIPSKEEWRKLVDYAGGFSTSAYKLKAKDGWLGNGNGSDEYGFSALPGGTFQQGDFGGWPYMGFWWGSTFCTDNSGHGYYYHWISDENKSQWEYHDPKSYFHSVRCVLGPYSSNQSSTGGCYIATCVYGSYDCPEVWTLRQFRDNELSNSWLGRQFIRIYYAISPKIVELFGSKKWFTRLWRSIIDKIVCKLQKN